MTRTRTHKPRSPAAIVFYTQCRHWHGYLSAFAFLALIFFSATGILLNHPDWLSEDESGPQTVVAVLPADGVSSARHVKDVGRALAALATARLPIVGAYSSADIDVRQAFLRYEGVKGSSDVTVDLKSGASTARIRRADSQFSPLISFNWCSPSGTAKLFAKTRCTAAGYVRSSD